MENPYSFSSRQYKVTVRQCHIGEKVKISGIEVLEIVSKYLVNGFMMNEGAKAIHRGKCSFTNDVMLEN